MSGLATHLVRRAVDTYGSTDFSPNVKAALGDLQHFTPPPYAIFIFIATFIVFAAIVGMVSCSSLQSFRTAPNTFTDPLARRFATVSATLLLLWP